MSYLLDKQKYLFTKCKLNKLCYIACVKNMFLEEINLFKTISLLVRVEEVGSNINSQFKNKAMTSYHFPWLFMCQ